MIKKHFVPCCFTAGVLAVLCLVQPFAHAEDATVGISDEDLVPYLRASAKNNKKFHAAISISCLVEAAKTASRAVANSRPLSVTR